MKKFSTLKTVVLSILVAVLACAGGTVLVIFLVFPMYFPAIASSQYGRVEIFVGGTPLYFKREVRGRNFDGKFLSPNEGVCRGFDPETDIDFRSIDATIFYRIESDTLVLLVGNPPSFPADFNPDHYVTQPKTFPVKVQILEPTRLISFDKIETLYKDLDLKYMEIPLDKTLSCH